MKRNTTAALAALLLLTACGADPGVPQATIPSAPASEPPPPSEAVPASAEPSAASAIPSASIEPPELFGTWRTTLGGVNLILRLTPETYRIVRGSNAADGDVSVDGDQIDFFNSSLCPGTGEYRWRIEGDSLRFSSLTEPCPGRAEALLNVRYSDYSPPD